MYKKNSFTFLLETLQVKELTYPDVVRCKFFFISKWSTLFTILINHLTIMLLRSLKFMSVLKMNEQGVWVRGVHQTAKTAPKPPAKKQNHTAPQVIVHHTAPHRMVQCSLRFYNKKTAQTTPHHLYILIYLIIFNIKYIINSLITLVFQKKKKFNNPSKCWLRKPAKNKEKLAQ